MNKLSLLASSLLFAACAADSAPEEPVSGELGLSSATTSARIIRNQSVMVSIEIVRSEGLVGPVAIEVDGLPAGVSVKPLEIADGESQGYLEITAGDGIELGTTAKVTIRASAGEASTSMTMDMRLTDRPGALDKTFGVQGIAQPMIPGNGNAAIYGVALQPDGKMLVAAMDYEPNAIVARLHPDGTLDESFGTGGVFSVPMNLSDTIIGIARRPDGVILVAIAKATTTSVYALTASGQAFPGYGNKSGAALLDASTTGGEFNARAMSVQSDGSMFLVGRRGIETVVVHLMADGSLDPKFSGDGVADFDFGGTNHPVAIMRRPDGRVVIAGHVVEASSSYYFAMAQLRIDGSPDPAFAVDGVHKYDALPQGGMLTAGLLPDGRVSAFGVDAKTGQRLVLTVEQDGRIDMAQAQAINMTLLRTMSLPDGVLAVGGLGNYDQWGVVKVDGTGLLDTRFGEGGRMWESIDNGTHALLAATPSLDPDRAIVAGFHDGSGATTPTVLKLWL